MSSVPVWIHSNRKKAAAAYQAQGQAEADRASRLVHPAAAQNFLHARHVMRKLVARECRIEPEDVTLRAYDDARSSIQGLDTIGVSWSRSGPHAFAALMHEGRVGADIEQLQPLNTGPVLKMIASDDERSVLDGMSGDEALKGFYRLWCAKEAVLKWRGKGLRGGPKSVIVPGEFISGRSQTMELLDNDVALQLLEVGPSDDWVAVLAFSG